jgi:hypothetical protein
MLPKPDLEKLPEEIIERLPKSLPKIEKLEDVPRYLESQGLLLDDLNVRMQTLVELTQTMLRQIQRVPQGIQCTIEKTITGNIPTVIDLQKEPDADYKVWYSATITNDEDSENDVYVVVNLPTRKYRKLRPSESLSVDFHAPLLQKIYLKCNAVGETASVVIVGEY